MATLSTGTPGKRLPFRARLPQPSLEYRSAIGRRLARGEGVDEHTSRRRRIPGGV
jgi:hypothetical protein